MTKFNEVKAELEQQVQNNQKIAEELESSEVDYELIKGQLETLCVEWNVVQEQHSAQIAQLRVCGFTINLVLS